MSLSMRITSRVFLWLAEEEEFGVGLGCGGGEAGEVEAGGGGVAALVQAVPYDLVRTCVEWSVD